MPKPENHLNPNNESHPDDEQISLREDIKDCVKAIFSGANNAIEDLIKTITHPIDEFVYPVSELIYDATIIAAAQDYSINKSEIKDNDFGLTKKLIEKNSKIYHDSLQRMQKRMDHLSTLGEALKDASWPKKIELLSQAATTILVPGYFVQGVKAAANINKFGTPFNPPRFHVVKTDDLILPVPKINTLSQAIIRDQYKPKSFMYVINNEGRLLLANEKLPKEIRLQSGFNYLSHPELVNLEPIVAAGFVKVSQGKIRRIKNNSGHYYPDGKHLKNVVETVFARHGFVEAYGKFRYIEPAKYAPDYSPIMTQTKLGYTPSRLGLGLGTYKAFDDNENSNVKFQAFVSDAKASELDDETIHLIKKTLKNNEFKTDQEKLEQLDHLIETFDDPTIMNQQLSVVEKSELHHLIQKNEENALTSITDKMKELVSAINIVFDNQTFQTQYQKSVSLSENDPLPFLNTIYNVAASIFPEDANRIAGTAIYSSKMLNGAIDAFNLFNTIGFNALISSMLSFATRDFLSGFAGLYALFGKKKENDSLLPMLQSISNQISMLHHDLLDFMRANAMAFGVNDAHVKQGFMKMEQLLNHNQQALLIQFEHLKQLFYVDLGYLQTIKKLAEEQTQYDLRQQIHDADWSNVVDEVSIRCKQYPKSMSVNHLKDSIEKLMITLRKIHRENEARAAQLTDLTDYPRLFNMMSVHSQRMSPKQSISIADRYRLSAEQNLPLLIKAINLPFNKTVYNPAALTAISYATENLIKTYRNTFGYLGLPEDSLREIVRMIYEGIDNFEEFLTVLKNENIMEKWINQYLTELQHLAQYVEDFLHHGLDQHYSQNVLPKIKAQLTHDEIMLTTLDSHRKYDFFKMQGNRWFEILWMHVWSPNPGGWSSGAWNQPACHRKGDRPCFIPLSDIKKTKAVYRESHHKQAEKRFGELNAYFQTKKAEIEKSFQVSSKTKHLEQQRNAFFINKPFVSDWASIPYFFQNEQYPILVSDRDLQQIPDIVFKGLAVGAFNLYLTAKFIKQTGNIQFQAISEMNDNGYKNTIILFNKESPTMPGIHYLSLPESLHYFIYGGSKPVGDCKTYDPDLRRFSDSQDRMAMSEYIARKAPNDCGHCHAIYRAVVCLPETESVTGLYPDAASFSKLPDAQLRWVSNWKYTLANSSDVLQLERSVWKYKKNILRQIISSLGNIIRSDNSQVTGLSEEESHLYNKIILSSQKLSVYSIQLKMMLSWLGDEDLNYFESLYDSTDILREIDQYSGGQFFLHDKLKIMHDGLSHKAREIIEQVKAKKIEHYPFTAFKQQFQKYITQIVLNDLVPDYIANSRPNNIPELLQFYSYFPMLDQDIQQKLLLISPQLKAHITKSAPNLLPPQNPAIKVITAKEQEEANAGLLPGAEAYDLTMYKPTASGFDFDYGAWDPKTKIDRATGEKIYTYRVYRGIEEIGSADFFGESAFCYSSDFTQHNLIEARGVFKDIELKPEMAKGICRVLPPDIYAKSLQSAKEGAVHGFLRGSANVLSSRLEEKGFSKSQSKTAANVVYYGGLFAMKVASQSSRLNDLDSSLMVIYESAIETGKIWLINTALGYVSTLLADASKEARKSYWEKTATGLDFCSSYLKYGIFAHDAIENGIIPTVSSLTAGTVSQEAIELLAAKPTIQQKRA